MFLKSSFKILWITEWIFWSIKKSQWHMFFLCKLPLIKTKLSYCTCTACMRQGWNRTSTSTGKTENQFGPSQLQCLHVSMMPRPFWCKMKKHSVKCNIWATKHFVRSLVHKKSQHHSLRFLVRSCSFLLVWCTVCSHR